MVIKRNLVPVVLALLLASLQAEVVDRTIAVVNNHPLTWSDLDEQMRFEALENGHALNTLGESERRAAFEHLVQYRILRDQMQGTPPATDSDVEARIGELRNALQMGRDDSRWLATLKLYEISVNELTGLVKNQIEILRFMEFRVRPLVTVSRTEVEDYYTSTLTPRVIAQGQTPEALEALRPKIRELLVEQKMNQEMEKWLKTLRDQSRVQVLWEGVR
jgi:hypothetical protein